MGLQGPDGVLRVLNCPYDLWGPYGPEGPDGVLCVLKVLKGGGVLKILWVLKVLKGP